ncbi:Rieske 2Fe-2S domain-containing protein [Sphingobium xenophagum]|uniref:Rieske 2Fe-2S domain-containing protein n=1 Tax=Sphingobium xenophagum TaxID=121428 RepID=UPI0038F5E3EC
MGTLKEDRIVCGYHRLAFDMSGKCVEAPTSSDWMTKVKSGIGCPERGGCCSG